MGWGSSRSKSMETSEIKVHIQKVEKVVQKCTQTLDEEMTSKCVD